MAYVLVFVGAGIGGTLRHAVGAASLRLWGTGFPIGTLAVNIIGSFLVGILAGYGLGRPLAFEARIFLVTGVLGGFTTFSAFSLDTLTLIERNEGGAALLYVGGSVLLSLAAVGAGFAIAK
jgi:CrcB protein